MYIAKTNIVGPTGETILNDSPIPDDWDKEYVDALLAGGAIEDVDVPDTAEELTDEPG